MVSCCSELWSPLRGLLLRLLPGGRGRGRAVRGVLLRRLRVGGGPVHRGYMPHLLSDHMIYQHFIRSTGGESEKEQSCADTGELGPDLHHLGGDQDHLIRGAGGWPPRGDPQADQQTRRLLSHGPEGPRRLPKYSHIPKVFSQSTCNVTEPSSSSKSFYITMNIGKNFDKKFSIDGLKEQTWYKMVLSQKQIGVKTTNY